MSSENSAILVEVWPTHEGRGRIIAVEAAEGGIRANGALFPNLPLPQWQIGPFASPQYVLKPDTPENRAYYGLNERG